VQTVATLLVTTDALVLCALQMQYRAVGWWRCAHAIKYGVINSPVAEGVCNRLSGAATYMPTDGLAFIRANSSAAGSQAGQQAVQNSLLVNTLDMVSHAQ